MHTMYVSNYPEETAMRLALAVLIVALAAVPASAAWYTSANYAIEQDVLASGGNHMTSASYVLDSTLGQPSPVGLSNSASYALQHGFWHQEYLVGDVNGDWCVNVADLLIVRNNLGKPAGSATPGSDVNGDGSVNVADLLIVRNNMGKGPACAP
jgi:hypothetical protein